MTDPGLLAERARLRYVSDEEPGISRRRRGKGFSYIGPDGKPITESDHQRISTLVIPPAWTEVWISRHQRSHLQATGRDAAGRKQYIYHPGWEEVRDEAKFDRLGPFGQALPRLRKKVQKDLAEPGWDHSKIIALATDVLDKTLIRIGNKYYTEQNGSFGLTTLESNHASVVGKLVKFEFTGKSGVEQSVEVKDARLATLMSQCQELAGQDLFSYPSGDGIATVTSSDVNEYVRKATRDDFTAKDFRTWGASALATDHLGQVGPPDGLGDDQALLDAVDRVASVLGNTRAVARASYVHPIVSDAYVSGDLQRAWVQSRRSIWMKRPESALARLLGG